NIVMPKNIFQRIIMMAAMATLPLAAAAIAPGEACFADEKTDTATITRMLSQAETLDLRTPNARMAALGRMLADTPYAAGTLEGDTECLRIDMQRMDCTTFVETVAAMAITIGEGRSSWHDMVYNLERLRYRQGHIDGYASRLHYISDWIIDNAHRGTLTDMTSRVVTTPSYQVKTLDFITRNRDKYPALADSATFEAMKNMEIGFRSHRFPYIKTSAIDKADIQEGDIIAIVTKTPGLDVQHIGIATRDTDGKIHLLHASSAAGKVIVDPLPLATYIQRRRTAQGIRVVRLNN
ncbi:MAG: DUF1460 domain-containing protein, partial [Paramuribaculum sp.]|nr:DUF1460 domain-containing protein [Paramuribaculum sp.]